jgi:hypothetical protein
MKPLLVVPGVLLGALALACSAPSSPAPSSPTSPAPEAASSGEAGSGDRAPTYTELFDNYFAPGTPGHCATAGCHADPAHNLWLCGITRDTCYAGMLEVGLIDAENPSHSSIANPVRSPLTWINAAGGVMPLDAQGPNDAAREAITAWVAAGAPDN